MHPNARLPQYSFRAMFPQTLTPFSVWFLKYFGVFLMYITKENEKQCSAEIAACDGGGGVWWMEVTCEVVEG